MRTALLFLLLTAASLLGGNPWPGVAYTEVRAFTWNPKTTTEELMDEKMNFADGVTDRDGVVLNADQVKRLLAAQSRRWKERPVAACYIPHNAFVFYDAQKKPVAFLEICFDCLGSRSHPADKDSDPDFVALAKLCSELKLSFGKAKTVEEFIKENGSLLGITRPKPAGENKP